MTSKAKEVISTLKSYFIWLPWMKDHNIKKPSIQSASGAPIIFTSDIADAQLWAILASVDKWMGHESVQEAYTFVRNRKGPCVFLLHPYKSSGAFLLTQQVINEEDSLGVYVAHEAFAQKMHNLLCEQEASNAPEA